MSHNDSSNALVSSSDALATGSNALVARPLCTIVCKHEKQLSYYISRVEPGAPEDAVVA